MRKRDIERLYKPKLKVLVESLQNYLRQDGFVLGEMWDMGDEDGITYAFLVYRGEQHEAPAENDIDIQVKLIYSEEYDGTPWGLNFSLSVVEVGGIIINIFSPYNHTDRCWVERKNADAIEERWTEFKYALDQGVGELAISLADAKPEEASKN